MNNSAQMMEACQVFTPKQSKTKHKVFFSLFFIYCIHFSCDSIMCDGNLDRHLCSLSQSSLTGETG